MLKNALENHFNQTTTENGANAFKSTLSAQLDLFAQIGALRGRSLADKENLFSKALGEDRLLAMKNLFRSRDIRGGLGEKDTFKQLLRFLAIHHPQLVRLNLENIPFYGRWDDLYVFDGTELEAEAYACMKKQFEADLVSERPSLLAKWIKSEKTKSRESRRLAYKTMLRFGIDTKNYGERKKFRKQLVALRQKLHVVEPKMVAKQWSEIDYESVPSKASMNYRHAFGRNDTERYTAYIEAVQNGEKKINASTLLPYDIISKVRRSRVNDVVLELQWQAIEKEVGEYFTNALVMADVSSSMYSSNETPFVTSIAMGILGARCIKGEFNGYFMTFESKPNLIKLQGANLADVVYNVMEAPWGGSTNIKAAFDLILEHAVKNNIPASSMPEKFIIVSDMEFDRADGSASAALFGLIKQEWAAKGYEKMPELVMWNVDARGSQYPMTKDDRGVTLISGYTHKIFESVLKSKNLTPVDLMLEELNKERYDLVKA